MSDLAKGAAGGEEFMRKQAAQVKAAAEAEAARVAALGDDTLPEGAFATKQEALDYLDQERAKGRHPQVMAEDGSGDFLIEVSSPYKGHATMWLTHVTDERDPNFPSEG